MIWHRKQALEKINAGELDCTRKFRLGGLVVEGSVKHASTTMRIDFLVTDLDHDIEVLLVYLFELHAFVYLAAPYYACDDVFIV